MNNDQESSLIIEDINSSMQVEDDHSIALGKGTNECTKVPKYLLIVSYHRLFLIF